MIPQSYSGSAADLSERGVLVELSVPDPVYALISGQRRVVRLKFAEDVFPGRLMGHVAWSDHLHRSGRLLHRIGVYFEEMDWDTRTEWVRFLSSQSSVARR